MLPWVPIVVHQLDIQPHPTVRTGHHRAHSDRPLGPQECFNGDSAMADTTRLRHHLASKLPDMQALDFKNIATCLNYTARHPWWSCRFLISRQLSNVTAKQRPNHCSSFGYRAIHDFRDSKITKFCIASLHEENVLGFDVAVKNLLLVNVGKRWQALPKPQTWDSQPQTSMIVSSTHLCQID